MKKLFTFLTLLMLFGSVGNTWAAFQYETTTYDFATAAQGSPSITMGASYSGIYAGNKAVSMTNGSTTTDISRLAFRYTGANTGNDRGWYLRVKPNDTNIKGLFCTGTNYTPQLAICDLHAGDKVTITYTSDQSITYTSGAHIYNDSHETSNIYSGVAYTLAQDGDLIIQANDGSTYIQTIKIEELTSVATYSITSNVNSNGVKENRFEFTGEGRMMDTQFSIPLVDVEFGSKLNGTFVHSIGTNQYGSYMPDQSGYWHTWFGETEPYQGTFYKFTPMADGKFQAGGYLSGGEIFVFHKVSEGYYEMAGSASGTGYITLTNSGQWINLKKGHTYYITEHPYDGHRDYNNFQLHWFQFNNYFDIPELGKVLTNGATSGELVTVKTNGQAGGAGSYNFTWEVKKASSNIKTSGISVTCNNGVVNISGIAYNDESKDKAGTIILGLHFDGGDADFVVTIPYSAAWNNGQGHVWDFSNTRNHSNATDEGYDGNLLIGKYSDTSSQMYQETQAGKWQKYWTMKGMAGGTHDDYYQNTRLMNKNNATMIWETEGLVFEAPAKTTGLYNEPDVDTYIGSSSGGIGNDHYVAILPGASFTIPGLTQGDRVLIKMGNSEASNHTTNNFTITGACDAIGKEITSTYGHGGTKWYTQGGAKWGGVYNFIAKGGDMKFTFLDGWIGKIYSIEIYRGTKKVILDMTRYGGTKDGKAYQAAYWVNNTYKQKLAGEEPARASITPHFLGKDQNIRITVLYKSGTVNIDANHLTVYNKKVWFQSEFEQYGMFRLRMDDMDKTNTYVADYALQNMLVGYLDKKNYPYTWDMTDLYTYATTNDRLPKEIQNEGNYGPRTEDGTNNIEYSNNTVGEGVKTVDMWKQVEAEGDLPAGYALYNRDEAFDLGPNEWGNGAPVWNVGQLYAGDHVFDEAFGLSFERPDNNTTYNANLRICDGGIYVKGGNWRVVVPEVGSIAALYVRVGKIGSDAITCGIVDGEFDYVGDTNDGSGDKIYAVKGTGSDITLYFNNAIIKKIAVSQDSKTVNILGYATESRNVEIDPELMGYMTGTGLKAYAVTSINYATANTKANVGLTEITTAGTMATATTGDHNAYIIYNSDEGTPEDGKKQVNILNGGFHLFVPDMHDKAGTANAKKSFIDVSGNKLISNLESSSIPQTDGMYTNYLMNYKYYDPNKGLVEDDYVEAFYRARAGATLGSNKAYLKMETAKVDPKQNPYANAPFILIFEGDEEGSETTVIDGVECIGETSGDDAIYTLSGMRVSNPQRGVIYVKNGKKFIVK
ncbi:MAG: hypothetical protein IKQ77_01865 [Prevotella sp.]|nr:hypothetical protein [Prevotella sp.]